MLKTFGLGSDPELPLIDNTGKFIASIGKIGGSKDNPLKTEHGYVQEDNVLLEFNSHPASSREDFIQNISDVLFDISNIITPLGLQYVVQSSCEFEDDQFYDMKALQAGCDPDIDAWTGEANTPPDLFGTQLRSGGGHLHISFDCEEDVEARFDLVKILDMIAGVPSVLMDNDTRRRSLYGKAGACRLKFALGEDPYDGVEYRTLSNFWLRSRDTIGWAYSAVERAISEFDELRGIVEGHSREIITAINNSDKKIAEKLVKEFNLEVVNA